MSLRQSYVCPDCFLTVRGEEGSTLTCGGCSRQFTAASVTPIDEDELTLAPIDADLESLSTIELPGLAVGDRDLQLQVEVAPPDQSCKQCLMTFGANELECPNCGCNATLGRQFDPAELDPYHGAFGFDRYLMRHTQDSNTSGLMLWCQVFLSFIGIVIMLIFSVWSYVVVIGLAVLYTAYRLHANSTNAFRRGKGLIPKVLLLYNRLTSWKGFLSSDNQTQSIISMRSPRFNDNSIASINPADLIEILDVAGSSITDTGVRYLATFANLRVLVVQGCTVGEDALDELQLALPCICIWRP